MKTQVYQSAGRRIRLAPVVIGLALLLSACGSGSKGGNAISNGFVPGCTNCPVGSGTVLAAALGLRNDPNQRIELGLRVHEPTTAFPPYAYNGPVSTSGYLLVTAPMGGCTALPVGRYQIATLPPNGMYAPDLSYYPWNLSGVDFDVVHESGLRYRAHVDYAEFDDQPVIQGADGAPYPQALYGQLRLTPMTMLPPSPCAFTAMTLFFPKNI